MKHGWAVYAGESKAGNRVAHITPINDIREHTLNADCWCEPELDEKDMVATHNSADGREAYEENIKQRH